MREIKFRVWEKENKVMIEFYPGDNLTNEYFFEPNIIMQFTGLKDKNGKEIYEGDVVIVPNQYPFNDEGKSNYVGIIEWINCNWSFEVVLKCVNKNKRGISDGINENISNYTNSKDEIVLEVIGNIYENPELLKKKL